MLPVPGLPAGWRGGARGVPRAHARAPLLPRRAGPSLSRSESGSMGPNPLPSAEGMTALHWASQEGHLNMVQVLLKVGADVEATNEVSLKRETHSGYVDTFRSGICVHALAWRVHSTGGRPCDHLLQCAWLVRVRSAGCPARESVATCRGRSCLCGPAADLTPALQYGRTYQLARSLRKGAYCGGADAATARHRRSARDEVGAAGVPLALAWRCERMCLPAMCVCS